MKTDLILVIRVAVYTSIYYLSFTTLGFTAEVVVLFSLHQDSASKIIEGSILGAFQ
jgi:hypothetical protein